MFKIFFSVIQFDLFFLLYASETSSKKLMNQFKVLDNQSEDMLKIAETGCVFFNNTKKTLHCCSPEKG